MHELSRDFDNLRIKKGVVNIKITGKDKSRKIKKHGYFSNQDTLDKYVNSTVQSRHSRVTVRNLPVNQSTLDMFFGKPRTHKMSKY